MRKSVVVDMVDLIRVPDCFADGKVWDLGVDWDDV